MERAAVTLLLIEGHRAAATSILKALSRAVPPVECVASLADGLRRLERPGVVGLVLDLFLPDSTGIETFSRVRAAAPSLPILVICRKEDEAIGALAVERGAEDFIPDDHLDTYSLTRAVKRMLDVSAREDALFAEKERAEVTLNSIGDGVLSTDLAGRVIYLNAVAERLTGWSRVESVGRPVCEIFNIVDGKTHAAAQDPLELAVRENRTVTLTDNCVLIHRDGHEVPIEDSTAPIHDRQGRTTGAVIVFHDVTETRQISTQLSYFAQHDFLTGLPNRMLLNDRLQQAITLAQRHEHKIAVLFLDLDRFKHINDSLGHLIGDRLLKAVAVRLRLCVRQSDTVGRHGGDEFIAVLAEIGSVHSAHASVAKLLAALTRPYEISGHVLHIRVSIGVSIYPGDGEDAGSLISNADTAMYHAKENGRHNYQFFNREMVVRAIERQFIEDNLHGALEHDQFSLHYQPKIDLATGAIVGVEALLRWTHPDRGLIPPAEFVPVAEDTGLILPIGRWVLSEACRQSRAWAKAGLPPVPVAVNISALEFRSKDFVGGIRDTLQVSGLEARYLELELTESVLMKHADSTISMLKALKCIGVRLTVDDFGTGYSSLSYLRQFPIDSLKVDQSFVHEISSHADDGAIASAVISMGSSLRKRVIAEGVETREQLDFLTAEGCQEAQGFFFSYPVAAGACATMLAAGVLRLVPE
jgi:diguanylate cyclase (GGDEF)-like protein/PAS domain S-box-containing protein